MSQEFKTDLKLLVKIVNKNTTRVLWHWKCQAIKKAASTKYNKLKAYTSRLLRKTPNKHPKIEIKSVKNKHTLNKSQVAEDKEAPAPGTSSQTESQKPPPNPYKPHLSRSSTKKAMAKACKSSPVIKSDTKRNISEPPLSPVKKTNLFEKLRLDLMQKAAVKNGDCKVSDDSHNISFSKIFDQSSKDVSFKCDEVAVVSCSQLAPRNDRLSLFKNDLLGKGL